jgi:hypothetical protein
MPDFGDFAGVYSNQGGQSSYQTGTPYGVWGDNGAGGSGVIGAADNGVGVWAWSKSDYLYALVAQSAGGGQFAAFFDGNITCDSNANIFGDLKVGGTLSKAAGQFKIDHPLDPANKYLAHSFVESPDMKNIYDGVVVFNANGEAVVELPAWFEPLNQDFRYQLTPLGAPAPNLYIAEEIRGNRFRIAGGSTGQKVSWQVTGIRHDAYANAHRLVVEEAKVGEERGRFLHPELHGQPADATIQPPRPLMDLPVPGEANSRPRPCEVPPRTSQALGMMSR